VVTQAEYDALVAKTAAEFGMSPEELRRRYPI
jgi:hypothetical protein